MQYASADILFCQYCRQKSMYQRILVPVDGSGTASRGLAEAITLAKTLKAGIRLIHVVIGVPTLYPPLSAPAVQTLLDQLRSSGESILHDAMTTVRAAGVSVDCRLIEALGAEAGERIIEQASAWPADLIVCGTHGRRGVRRILMGSDAEHIVRHSPVPVLMIRAPETSEQG
jgi:nucleotide-binding universal stress UspA family protein